MTSYSIRTGLKYLVLVGFVSVLVVNIVISLVYTNLSSKILSLIDVRTVWECTNQKSDYFLAGKCNNWTKQQETAEYKETVCLDAKFMPEGSMPYILLISFPGSGNTWVRYLIERATGIYTGSVGNDPTLHEGGFLGQLLPARSGQVIIVKAHEVDTREKLDGLVLLIRNPYDAIVSDFNRKYTKGNHTGLVPVQRFKTKDWRSFVELRSNQWGTLIGDCLNARTKNIHIIYYEDLKKALSEELKGLVDFLGLSLDVDRLKCAINVSEGKYHRPQRTLPFDPFTKKMRWQLNREINRVRGLLINHRLPVLKKYQRNSK